MAHSRAHIRLHGAPQITEFVSTLNSLGGVDKYIIEDFEGVYTVDARSFLGVLYASVEFNDDMYLVNVSEDGMIPSAFDKYRV